MVLRALSLIEDITNNNYKGDYKMFEINPIAKNKLKKKLFEDRRKEIMNKKMEKYCKNGICPKCGEDKKTGNGKINPESYFHFQYNFWFECYKCKFKFNW